MHSRFKVAVVMVVVCVGAFALHLLQKTEHPTAAGSSMLAPRLSTEDLAAAVSAARPADAATAGASAAGALIYPDPAAVHALQLGYASFTRAADGSMMAVPLPPHAAWQTMLALPVAGHRRLVLALSDPKCGFGVAVNVYRADRAEPAWYADLAAHGASGKHVLDLSTISGADPLLVGLKMADDAQNNWSCNVALHWDDTP